jgi:hypothetical protein
MILLGWVLLFLPLTGDAHADSSGAVLGDAACSVGAIGGGAVAAASTCQRDDSRLLRLSGGGAAEETDDCLDGDADWEAANSRLRRYLDSASNQDGEFLIQGWRWHTMALAREAQRLHVLGSKLSKRGNETQGGAAASASSIDVESLRKAADYVVGFNMRGLHRIERDVFFPWVRKHVIEPLSHRDREASEAVSVVLGRLESQQRTVERLGQTLVRGTYRFRGKAECPLVSPTSVACISSE